MRIAEVGQWSSISKTLTTAVHHAGSYPFSGRVEVKDAETGAFIKGAAVQLNADGKANIDITDDGGNAAFTNISMMSRSPTYMVTAFGYAQRTVPAKDREVVVIGLIKQSGASSRGGRVQNNVLRFSRQKPGMLAPTSQEAQTGPAGASKPVPWLWIGIGSTALVLVAIIASVRRSP